MRTVHRILDSTSVIGGRGRRIIGSTDIDGQGTRHALPDLGPFVMVDDARGLSGPGLPPFGQHPHAGLVAISFIAGGGDWHSWCNLPGCESVDFGAGDVLFTQAGRGAVHDETSASEGDHEMLQIILRLPAAHREGAPSLHKRRASPVAPGVVRAFGPADVGRWGLDAAVFFARVPASGQVDLPLATSHTTGWAFAREGTPVVGGTSLATHQVGLLGPEGTTLRIAAADAPAQVLVGTAAPLDEPWVKLLGHNGFVVAGTPDAARAKMAAYARQGEAFGR